MTNGPELATTVPCPWDLGLSQCRSLLDSSLTSPTSVGYFTTMAQTFPKPLKDRLLLAYLAQLSAHPLRTKALTTGKLPFNWPHSLASLSPVLTYHYHSISAKGHSASFKRCSAPIWPMLPSRNPPKMHHSSSTPSHAPRWIRVP